MPVLLVRHGDALPMRERDDTRVLSARGRSDVRKLGAMLRERAIAPAAVIASPLVRAVMTAELLVGELRFAGVVEIDEDLVPDGDPWRAAAALEARAPALVVAVTHEPIVRVLAAQLLGRSGFRAFRTSEAVLVDAQEVTLELCPS